MEIQSWLLFLSIAFIATITPGPAILLATSHSLSFGLKKSVFTILGNITGLFLMSAMSVAGLSAIILGSSVIFAAVKLGGALYLVCLGVRLWRNGFMPVTAKVPGVRDNTRPGKLYANGLAVALSNPKAIAFTTALFPQFITPGNPLLPQFGILVITFMFLSFVCIFGYAYAAYTTRNRFLRSPRGFLSKCLGTGFIASGLALATARQRVAP